MHRGALARVKVAGRSTVLVCEWMTDLHFAEGAEVHNVGHDGAVDAVLLSSRWHKRHIRRRHPVGPGPLRRASAPVPVHVTVPVPVVSVSISVPVSILVTVPPPVPVIVAPSPVTVRVMIPLPTVAAAAAAALAVPFVARPVVLVTLALAVLGRGRRLRSAGLADRAGEALLDELVLQLPRPIPGCPQWPAPKTSRRAASGPSDRCPRRRCLRRRWTCRAATTCTPNGIGSCITFELHCLLRYPGLSSSNAGRSEEQGIARAQVKANKARQPPEGAE